MLGINLFNLSINMISQIEWCHILPQFHKWYLLSICHPLLYLVWSNLWNSSFWSWMFVMYCWQDHKDVKEKTNSIFYGPRSEPATIRIDYYIHRILVYNMKIITHQPPYKKWFKKRKCFEIIAAITKAVWCYCYGMY